MIQIVILLLVCLILACRTNYEADPRATRVTLDSLLALHAQHFIAKDIEAIANTYSENAVVRSNHMEPLRGRPAIRQFISELLSNVDIRTLKYNTEKLAVYGDSAWQIMTYELVVRPAGAPEQSDRGSAIDLWVRDRSGVWRIQDNVINSSLPLAPLASRR